MFMIIDIIDIYIDGVCKGNFGFGGWGVLLCYGSQEKELFGGELNMINNCMELMGVIVVFEVLKWLCWVIVYIDL